MARIKSIEHVENHKTHLIVHALLEDGEECSIYVGGEVEVFYHKGTIKAYVKRAPGDK